MVYREFTVQLPKHSQSDSKHLDGRPNPIYLRFILFNSCCKKRDSLRTVILKLMEPHLFISFQKCQIPKLMQNSGWLIAEPKIND